MPVVPFNNRPVQRQIDLGPAEPWALMAAAQMDAEGRLVESNIDDRRDQGRKETDNRMVEDQQLPRTDYGDPAKDAFGKLNRDLGSSDLDTSERDNIVKAIERGIAARSKR